MCVGPKVKFQTSPNGSAAVSRLLLDEPLSNHTLDRAVALVTLVRQQGTHLVSTVSVTSRDGTAKSGRDFQFESHNVTFLEGVVSMTVTVVILANHLSQDNLSFSLELVGLPDHTFDPAYFSFQDSIEIIIVNRVIEGPYFLAPPQLDNKEDWGRSYSGGQYFDLPLLCISVSWNCLIYSLFSYFVAMVTVM